MKFEESLKICQDFALKHKVIFDDEGECGFGRECVGFRSRNTWINHNPLNYDGSYEPIKEFSDDRLYSPGDINAYHKHDCLAVLGRGEQAIIQLATWVKHLENLGEVEIVEFKTGATGMQALLTGVCSHVVRIKK